MRIGRSETLSSCESRAVCLVVHQSARRGAERNEKAFDAGEAVAVLYHIWVTFGDAPPRSVEDHVHFMKRSSHNLQDAIMQAGREAKSVSGERDMKK